MGVLFYKPADVDLLYIYYRPTGNGIRLYYTGAERSVSKVSRNFRFKMAFDFCH